MTSAMDRLVESVRHDAGTYMMLIGAGCSRSAGIADGESLLARLAEGRHRNASVSLVEWYAGEYGRWPSYEAILLSQAGIASPATIDRADGLPHSSSSFRALLDPLFEPTPSEASLGIKVPGPAHRAVADLVRAGYLRLILTTNFDRLIERALVASGVPVRVIATPHAIGHALPLRLDHPTVVKLHGDWAAIRPKLLPREPRSYAEQPIVDLLPRLFADHHVIVVGWSGEWDAALRSALAEGSASRAVYWTTVGEPGSVAAAVLAARKGLLLRIKSADAFLSELAARLVGPATERAPIALRREPGRGASRMAVHHRRPQWGL